MTSYVIPVIFITVLLLSFAKRKDAYAAFVGGARSSVDLMVGVFPYLLAVMTAVEVFRQSGVSALLADLLSPAMRVFGIPKELTELMLIRPLSGAGALGVLENVFTAYGTDTYVGRCASVIYGSSETVFYIATIYFSQSKIRRLGFAVPVALLCTFIGCTAGCYLCRFL